MNDLSIAKEPDSVSCLLAFFCFKKIGLMSTEDIAVISGGTFGILESRKLSGGVGLTK
jgi:hypothetical protein